MLTASQFEVLRMVKRITDESKYNIAPVKEIIKEFEPKRKHKRKRKLKRKRDKGATARVRLTELKKLGLLENPILGAWRLTKKGEETIEQFEN